MARRNFALGPAGRGLLRLQKGTYGQQGEVLQLPYYDTITLATGAVSGSFFKSSTSSKTLAQTNMTIPNQIPQGQKLQVHAFQCSITPAAALTQLTIADLNTFLIDTYVEFKISNKAPMWQGTLLDIFGGAVNGGAGGASPMSGGAGGAGGVGAAGTGGDGSPPGGGGGGGADTGGSGGAGANGRVRVAWGP